MSAANVASPLAGIKVLDLSRVLAGPWCTMTLADLGCDVIKVENPAGGDDTRMFRPPEVGDESSFFLSCNRSKRSLALDFSKPEGQAIVSALAARADVLVENYRFGALAAYGLDYDTLAKGNPRLIYCSISGYGRNSPLAHRASYDTVMQAEGGLMSVTGELGGAPMKVGVSIADMLSGMNATQSILAALFARQRTGRGQFIDISLLDGVVAALSNQISGYDADGKTPQSWGTQNPFLAPCQAFDTDDGEIVLVIGNDRQFRGLCEALGRKDLATDARFAKNASRVANRDALVTELSAIFKSASRATWMSKLHDAGLPAGAIRNVPEVVASPEVKARGLIKMVAHPTAGEIRMAGSPLSLSETPLREPYAPPLLGQHSRQILFEELGYDAERVRALETAGIVRSHESFGPLK
ncbi:MAG TPA: CaiB/BaiF CoA-transferase family protein [Burkholderiaceae bacterium]|nr:CaiB/BaiF CoA-transferase family protein [Burkholderiaceae bacterium]